jgi:hypothetical protein
MKINPIRPPLPGVALFVLGSLAMGGLLAAVQVPPMALTGAQEVPAVETRAMGTSTIEVATDMGIKGNVETTGIEGTMAHIHMAARGINGPVVVTLEKQGENRWVVPAGTHLTADQFASYKRGGLYVNVHSAAHKDGELRLQLSGN